MYQRNKICGSTSPWAENRAKRRDLLIIKNDLEPQAWEPRLLVLGNDSERQWFQGKHRHLHWKPEPEQCLWPQRQRVAWKLWLYTHQWASFFLFPIQSHSWNLFNLISYLFNSISVSLESLWRRGGKSISPDSVYSINQDRLGSASVTNNLKVLLTYNNKCYYSESNTIEYRIELGTWFWFFFTLGLGLTKQPPFQILPVTVIKEKTVWDYFASIMKRSGLGVALLTSTQIVTWSHRHTQLQKSNQTTCLEFGEQK